MTVILAQNDRCGFPKWPLYLQIELTVILVQETIQNDRYGTKMTDIWNEPDLDYRYWNRVLDPVSGSRMHVWTQFMDPRRASWITLILR